MFKLFKKKKSIQINLALRLAMISWLEAETRARSLMMWNNTHDPELHKARREVDRRVKKLAHLLFSEMKETLPPGTVKSFEDWASMAKKSGLAL